LDDRFVEQAESARCRDLCAGAEGPRGLAPQRHVVRISAECRDIAAHPPKCGLLIGESEVAHGRVVQRRVVEETQGAKGDS